MTTAPPRRTDGFPSELDLASWWLDEANVKFSPRGRGGGWEQYCKHTGMNEIDTIAVQARILRWMAEKYQRRYITARLVERVERLARIESSRRRGY